MFTNATYAYGVSVIGSTAFIANRFPRQVVEVDLSDITAPKHVTNYAQLNQTQSVTINNGHLYAANGTAGVQVYQMGESALDRINISVLSMGAGLVTQTVKGGGEPFTENELAGLRLLGSSNLLDWTELNISATAAEGKANFDVERNGQRSFFRVRFE